MGFFCLEAARKHPGTQPGIQYVRCRPAASALMDGEKSQSAKFGQVDAHLPIGDVEPLRKLLLARVDTAESTCVEKQQLKALASTRGDAVWDIHDASR